MSDNDSIWSWIKIEARKPSKSGGTLTVSIPKDFRDSAEIEARDTIYLVYPVGDTIAVITKEFDVDKLTQQLSLFLETLRDKQKKGSRILREKGEPVFY